MSYFEIDTGKFVPAWHENCRYSVDVNYVTLLKKKSKILEILIEFYIHLQFVFHSLFIMLFSAD